MSIRSMGALTCAALSFSPFAHAQSSVTLYGVADASLVWQNHADTQGEDVVLMSNGAINHSRFGFIGHEDLGGGMSAIFQLESGFNLQDGTMASKGVIFDRYAYAGLKGDYGLVTLGNLGTPFYNTMENYDPLTVGDYYDTAWWYGTDTNRRANAINYSKDVGPFHALLAYGVGGVAGSVATGSQWGAALSFSENGVALASVYQQTKSPTSGGLQRILGLAGTYTYHTVTFYAGYQDDHDSAGIGNTQLNIVGAPQGTDNIARKDQGVFTGLTWQVTPFVLLREAYYYDVVHDAMQKSGNDGVHWTLVSEAEYWFSKRSSVYAQVDYNHTSGAARVELPYSNNQTEVAVGLREWF